MNVDDTDWYIISAIPVPGVVMWTQDEDKWEKYDEPVILITERQYMCRKSTGARAVLPKLIKKDGEIDSSEVHDTSWLDSRMRYVIIDEEGWIYPDMPDSGIPTSRVLPPGVKPE